MLSTTPRCIFMRMESTGSKIATAREAKGWNQSELARALGVTPQSVQAWESGRNTPRPKRLQEIAAALGVSAGYLMGEEALGSHNNVEGGPIKLKTGLVPVVGKAKLGLDGFFEEMGYPPGGGDGYLRIYSDDPDAYALRVVGSSMEPRIRSGEFVLVEPSNGYVAGDEVLVKTTDGQSMIKVFMYHRDGEVRLLSVNDAHPPLTLPEASITKLHPVGAIVKASRLVEL